MGHFHADFVPTSRGFDSWYGYYSSFTGYFSHVGELGTCEDSSEARASVTCYTDFNVDGASLAAEAGAYSTDLFAARAEALVGAHDAARPLFLYFAPTSCHGPVAAPLEIFEDARARANVRLSTRPLSGGAWSGMGRGERS